MTLVEIASVAEQVRQGGIAGWPCDCAGAASSSPLVSSRTAPPAPARVLPSVEAIVRTAVSSARVLANLSDLTVVAGGGNGGFDWSSRRLDPRDRWGGIELPVAVAAELSGMDRSSVSLLILADASRCDCSAAVRYLRLLTTAGVLAQTLIDAAERDGRSAELDHDPYDIGSLDSGGPAGELVHLCSVHLRMRTSADGS